MTPPQNRTPEPAAGDARCLVAALFHVSQFFKSYQVRALIDATIDVRRGEVFGVIGPEGSGKSTVLKLLAGRLRPDEGRVTVFDRSPRRPSVKARISYLADATDEPGPIGWTGFFKRFFSPAQRAGSGPGPNTASGTPRRAHVVHALARNADLIVLDEPFIDLDPASVRELKELIRTLAQRGATVVLSSDTLSDAKDVCDRVAILSEGKVQAIGTLTQLLAAPDAVRFTAPVLPNAISDRVLKIIREEMTVAITPSTIPGNSGDAAYGKQQTSVAEPAATTTAAETILTPLLKTNGPTPAPASLEVRKEPIDPVNHAKLADLTRPAATLPSTSKPA